MDDITIRTARDGDLCAIASIELEAASLFSVEDLPHSIRHSVTAEQDLAAAVGDARIWIAEAGAGQPVGFAMADVVDGNAHLDEMDVRPAFGRRGIGTRLVRKVVEWARAERFPRITLVTFRHLPWNAPFYVKLGFAELPAVDHGPELAGLIEAEGRIGIDTAQRVAMNLRL